MSFNAFIHSGLRWFRGSDNERTGEAYQVNTSKLSSRLWDVFTRTYDLGLTAFGGPPVHFQIFHQRFVNGAGKTPWIDEQTYQELFAICQALPGPASTKMLFSIAQIHAGLIPAVFVFLLWSFPGAIAMYGLSLGVQRINDILPAPVYALLSGLNAATVGIIALAAMQLARKAITDKLTRILVVFGACAGLCYNALWYFPVLITVAGTMTVGWDCWGRTWVRKLTQRSQKKRSPTPEPLAEAGMAGSLGVALQQSDGPHRRQVQPTAEEIELTTRSKESLVIKPNEQVASDDENSIPRPSPNDIAGHAIPVKIGLMLIGVFFAIFTTLMVLRGALHSTPLLLALYNNMFLAGTIIFGGGPVVIPLLREYVVEPGWVSPRDFLLGLAIIQAMPGPNFNFAIYLGALAVAGPLGPKSIPTIVGALLGFLGIFIPGLWLCVGFQSIWRALRKRQEVASILRGVNAAAVGFVFTAVYRLWEIGYLTTKSNKGTSLGEEPWWLVVAASTFAAVEWFSVPPPVSILAGGVAGLAWWGAVGR